jgi:hypothetical protein
VLCCIPLLGLAQGGIDIEQRLTPEQMHATGLDTLSPAQLTRLNQVLREDAGRPVVVGQSPGDNAERSIFSVGLDDKPIHSRLRGDVQAWEPGTVFELDNGEQWKVLKGRMTLHKTLHAPEIQVVPGLAGRWFLQVDEDLPKPRVYRIR